MIQECFPEAQTKVLHEKVERPEVSVVVPISERHDDLRRLYKLYSEELTKIGRTYEFLFVVDGAFPEACRELRKLVGEGNPVKVIKLARAFGESTALMEGFKQAKGKAVLTMAAYLQIEPEDLKKLFSAYEEGNDLVVSRRYPRRDPLINRIQSYAYHYLVRRLTGTPFRDITSGTRLFKKDILSQFVLYGDLHRFIPIFAVQQGRKVKEISVSQRKEDTQLRVVAPGVYLRRIIDILNLFFLVKFTRKPLRFFGLVGSLLILPGTIITLYLGVLRLFGATELANRPLLLFGIILIVFGIQIFSVGLVGELILFSHAKDIKDYTIEEIIE